jgi:hypothetical protein
MDCRPSQSRKPTGEAMSRNVLFGLLLTTGVVLADGTVSATEAQAKTEPAQGQSEPAQGQSEPAQGQSEDAQRQKTEPQVKAEEVPGQAAEGQAPTEGDAKLTSVPGGKALGISILGNQEAPTALVIVPWKTSELGGAPGISLMLDDSRQPVDKDVFMRALRYHEIRSGTTNQNGATAGSR